MPRQIQITFDSAKMRGTPPPPSPLCSVSNLKKLIGNISNQILVNLTLSLYETSSDTAPDYAPDSYMQICISVDTGVGRDAQAPD